MDKPLHVQVAEALGVKPVDADWGYTAPPAEGPWKHDSSRLFRDIFDARTAYKAAGLDPDEFLKFGDDDICYWKDGWGPIIIDRYDTDWSATGPLIERFQIKIEPAGMFWRAWANETAHCGTCGYGDKPLVAVCNLLLALKAAGRLAA